MIAGDSIIPATVASRLARSPRILPDEAAEQGTERSQAHSGEGDGGGRPPLHPSGGDGLPDGHDRDVNQLAACAEYEDDRRDGCDCRC